MGRQKTNLTRDASVFSKSTRVPVLKFVNRQQRCPFLPTSKTSLNLHFGFHTHSEEEEEEMENRARLKVQKKKPIKRSGKKLLLKKFLDYLKSDTFMYAPLVSPQPSVFPSPNAFKVVELKKPTKEGQWFREYLKSDVYMYGPLLELPLPPQEPSQDCGIIRMDASTGRSTMNVNQETDHLGNVNQRSESHLPRTRLSDRLTWGHEETVKHTVYQSCRPTSASRNVTGNSQLRAHG